jgi:hypothetical protein
MDRGENQNSRATVPFSRMNWPAPDYVLAAKRARGKALRGMILSLLGWARALIANRPSLETAVTVPIRTASKR